MVDRNTNSSVKGPCTSAKISLPPLHHSDHILEKRSEMEKGVGVTYHDEVSRFNQTKVPLDALDPFPYASPAISLKPQIPIQILCQ